MTTPSPAAQPYSCVCARRLGPANEVGETKLFIKSIFNANCKPQQAAAADDGDGHGDGDGDCGADRPINGMAKRTAENLRLELSLASVTGSERQTRRRP